MSKYFDPSQYIPNVVDTAVDYRDNLYALLKAMEILKVPVTRASWFRAVAELLRRAGADDTQAYDLPRKLALDIYRAARDAEVLEIMSLIDGNEL